MQQTPPDHSGGVDFLDIDIDTNIMPVQQPALFGLSIEIILSIVRKQRKFADFDVSRNYFPWLIAACAAARRAIGTRKGEQET